MKLKILFALCLIPALSGFSLADVVWDETVDGDLSGDFSNPDPLMFLSGANTIIGSVGVNGNTGATNGSDADYFSFSIGAFQQLSSITVDSFTFTGNDPGHSFLAYVAGGSFDGQGGGDIDGLSLFNASSMDVLGELNMGGPLGQGVYSFWIQEIEKSNVDYQLSFNVSAVPEPATPFLATMFALGYAARRRRVVA